MTVLTTTRLTLRPASVDDLEPCAAFWASERSHLMGGPWTTEETARSLDDVIAQWDRHGFGLFTVILDGQPVGGIGPFFPDTHPEPEIGWSLWDAGLEGRGLAHEAATAARDWFFARTGRRTLVSYADPENHRSNRLCERLGAVIDPGAPHPYAEPTLVWRHSAGGAA